MALDVYNNLELNQVRQAIAKHPKAYLLGSNGPDLFFYYNVYPWLDQTLNKQVAHYGNRVHEEHINRFYQVAVAFIQSLPSGPRKDILIAYLAGHLMHWSLDSIAHPFVFYRSGKLEGDTKYWHYRYESMIDALMITYVKRKDLRKVHIKEYVNVSQEERRVIASFYQMLLSEVFEIETSAEIIEDAIVGMKRLLPILYDPHGVKTPLIRNIETLFFEPWVFTSHMVNCELDATHDILNLGHAQWANPTNLEETSTASFVDLYDQSVRLGDHVLTRFEAILNENETTFDDLLKNCQYDTGRPVGRVMQYFSNVYR